MRIINYIMIIAGFFVFSSALLGFFISRWWLLFTIFVGLNVFQYGFTGFCPMSGLLKKMGIKD